MNFSTSSNDYPNNSVEVIMSNDCLSKKDTCKSDSITQNQLQQTAMILDYSRDMVELVKQSVSQNSNPILIGAGEGCNNSNLLNDCDVSMLPQGSVIVKGKDGLTVVSPSSALGETQFLTAKGTPNGDQILGFQNFNTNSSSSLVNSLEFNKDSRVLTSSINGASDSAIIPSDVPTGSNGDQLMSNGSSWVAIKPTVKNSFDNGYLTTTVNGVESNEIEISINGQISASKDEDKKINIFESNGEEFNCLPSAADLIINTDIRASDKIYQNSSLTRANKVMKVSDVRGDVSIEFISGTNPGQPEVYTILANATSPTSAGYTAKAFTNNTNRKQLLTCYGSVKLGSESLQQNASKVYIVEGGFSINGQYTDLASIAGVSQIFPPNYDGLSVYGNGFWIPFNASKILEPGETAIIGSLFTFAGSPGTKIQYDLQTARVVIQTF